VSGDPLFVHGTLGPSQDFHLQRGSPAIDSGAAVPVGDTDLDGVARPLRRGPDMGAYESNFEPIAPTITVTAPADGAIFNQNTVVNASYVCLPGLGTKVSSCSGPVASGSPIDTSTIGPHTFKVTAIDADGGTSSTNVSYTVTAGPVVGPSLTGLGQSVRRWRRSNKNNTGRHRLPVGTKFTFTLNEPASVTFSFSRSGAGRVMKGTCVKPNRRNRHKRRCALAAGALTVQGVAGANTVAFRGKKLRPGHYVATVAATAGGVTTSPQTLRFTVVR
jgi:hypothetical protein